MKSIAVAAGAAFLAILPAAARAQELGVQVGVFYPADSQLRDSLGDQWLSVGFGRVNMGVADRSKASWSWRSLSKTEDGSRIWMLSASYGYLWTFAKPGPFGEPAEVRPYFAVRGGPVYIDYAIDTPGGRVSSKRVGFNANAELGVAVGDRLTISARYDINSRFDDLRFDGLTLQAQYSLFRF